MNYGRLYIEGKKRPILVSTDPDTVRAAMDQDGVVTVTNLNGDAQISIPHHRIISFQECRKDEVQVDSAALFGKKYTFRSLAAYNGTSDAEDCVAVPEGQSAADYIVVLSEDLAEALVLVMNVATAEMIFVNPAEPAEAITRLATAARLVAEADQLLVEHYEIQDTVNVDHDLH